MKRLMAMAIVVAVVNVLGVSYTEGSSVVVTASSLWTDTGLTLSIGDAVTITASGTWRYSSDPAVGPDGVSLPAGAYDVFYSAALHGALIGFIGADPYQGHWGDGSFFPQATGYLNIGSNAQFSSNTAGKLWLGQNDDAVTEAVYDNSGSLTSQISVAPVPEPTTWSLLALGVGALLGGRRLRRRLS
jgi:hypothetical protein